MCIAEICVYQLDEGTNCWRSTNGYRTGEMTYMVLPTGDYDPEDENWEFKPGEIVVCKKLELYDGEFMVAYKIADWNTKQSNEEDVIYINILEAGPGGWRPTKGIKLDDMIYKVLPIEYYDRADEVWEFKPGSIVECKTVILSSNKTILVAFKLADSDGE